MARQFDSLDNLYSAAQRAAVCEDVLMNDVAPIVKEILRKHIETDVYGAYRSLAKNPYMRRGLLTSRITSKMISDDTMLVTSIAQPAKPADGWASSGDGAFLYMLEVGDLGWWRKDFPRPAISNAQREVDKSAAVERAKKMGLKRVMKK